MKKGLFAVKDRLNGFMNVFLEDNDDVAKRGFLVGLASQPEGSLFYVHPDDYSLYRLATIDLESGAILLEAVPQWIVSGDDSIKLRSVAYATEESDLGESIN